MLRLPSRQNANAGSPRRTTALKLLFDENLSFRLVELLGADYPGSTHVDLIGMRGASDEAVWQFAGAEDLVLVSKDDDFRHLSLVRGAPPKVVWLNVGNCDTRTVMRILHDAKHRIQTFSKAPGEALLILNRP